MKFKHARQRKAVMAKLNSGSSTYQQSSVTKVRKINVSNRKKEIDKLIKIKSIKETGEIKPFIIKDKQFNKMWKVIDVINPTFQTDMKYIIIDKNGVVDDIKRPTLVSRFKLITNVDKRKPLIQEKSTKNIYRIVNRENETINVPERFTIVDKKGNFRTIRKYELESEFKVQKGTQK